MAREILFEKVKQIVLENIDRCPAMRDKAGMQLVSVKMYLDTGKIIPVLSDRHKPSIEDMVKREIENFVKYCDIACVDQMLAFCPCGTDRRLPKWLYDFPLDADMDDEGRWKLLPRTVPVSSY